MNDRANPPAAGPGREERLAAKLRENLRRRKAQARALEQVPPGALTESPAESPTESGAALSKPPPSG